MPCVKNVTWGDAAKGLFLTSAAEDDGTVVLDLPPALVMGNVR